MTKTASKTMEVKIYTPFKIFFEGPALSLSAVNATGPFDVLPMHKNFITLLEPGTITVRSSHHSDFKIKIKRAVMHVKADQVTVFLDI